MPRSDTEIVTVHDRAVEVYLGLNHDVNLLGRLTARLTRERGQVSDTVPTHVRIGVVLADHRMVYWEALAGEGWTGPHAERKAQEWAAERPGRWTRLLFLDADPALRTAWEGLTPGRRREYALHVGGAKQAATRTSRAEAAAPKIRAGKGLRDR